MRMIKNRLRQLKRRTTLKIQPFRDRMTGITTEDILPELYSHEYICPRVPAPKKLSKIERLQRQTFQLPQRTDGSSQLSTKQIKIDDRVTGTGGFVTNWLDENPAIENRRITPEDTDSTYRSKSQLLDCHYHSITYNCQLTQDAPVWASSPVTSNDPSHPTPDRKRTDGAAPLELELVPHQNQSANVHSCGHCGPANSHTIQLTHTITLKTAPEKHESRPIGGGCDCCQCNPCANHPLSRWNFDPMCRCPKPLSNVDWSVAEDQKLNVRSDVEKGPAFDATPMLTVQQYELTSTSEPQPGLGDDFDSEHTEEHRPCYFCFRKRKKSRVKAEVSPSKSESIGTCQCLNSPTKHHMSYDTFSGSPTLVCVHPEGQDSEGIQKPVYLMSKPITEEYATEFDEAINSCVSGSETSKSTPLRPVSLNSLVSEEIHPIKVMRFDCGAEGPVLHKARVEHASNQTEKQPEVCLCKVNQTHSPDKSTSVKQRNPSWMEEYKVTPVSLGPEERLLRNDPQGVENSFIIQDRAANCHRIVIEPNIASPSAAGTPPDISTVYMNVPQEPPDSYVGYPTSEDNRLLEESADLRLLPSYSIPLTGLNPQQAVSIYPCPCQSLQDGQTANLHELRKSCCCCCCSRRMPRCRLTFPSDACFPLNQCGCTSYRSYPRRHWRCPLSLRY